METNWNDFIDFYDWEFNLLCNEQSQDIFFWLKMANMYNGNVLEFGCGTGRVSLELAKHGFEVTAVDLAEKFIDKLNSKNIYENLKTQVGDMTTFQSNSLYKLIIFPYSTFQFLLTENEQLRCLKNAKSLLKKDGRIILDVSPFIAKGIKSQCKTKLYSHWYSDLKCNVEMFTSFNIKNNIQSWKDEYLITNKNGLNRSFVHNLSLKKIDLEEFSNLCRMCDLKIENIYGSFDLKDVNINSSNYLIVLST